MVNGFFKYMTDEDFILWSNGVIQLNETKFNTMNTRSEKMDTAGIMIATWILALGVPTNMNRSTTLPGRAELIAQYDQDCLTALSKKMGYSTIANLTNAITAGETVGAGGNAPGTVYGTEDVSTLPKLPPCGRNSGV